MALNPWDYAAKTGNEFAHQNALFMWSNMAAKFGLTAAEDPLSYSVAGHALNNYGPANGPNAVPALFWLHAIKNQGHGDAIRGARSAQEGVKPGVPDMFLPVPMFVGLLATRLVYAPPYHVPETARAFTGLYIELKRPVSVGKSAGRESAEQERWRNYLRSVGYRVEVCYGWEAARACILDYLGLSLLNQ